MFKIQIEMIVDGDDFSNTSSFAIDTVNHINMYQTSWSSLKPKSWIKKIEFITALDEDEK